MKASLSSKKSAFSLVEVLVALALFSMAITVLSASIYSALQSVLSFETAIDREEDLRFLRNLIPYNLDKKALLSGGKASTPHSKDVSWSAQIEPTAVIDCFKVTLTYDFPKAPHKTTETYIRFITGWMDPVDRSSEITRKKEASPTGNRLPSPDKE